MKLHTSLCYCLVGVLGILPQVSPWYFPEYHLHWPKLPKKLPEPPQELPKPPKELREPIAPEMILDAFQTAQNAIRERRISSESIFSQWPIRGCQVQEGDVPSVRHQIFQNSDLRSRRMESVQEVFEEASRILATRLDLDPADIANQFAKVNLSIVGNEVQNCEDLFKVNCRSTDRYRTFDGTCNNLDNPSWGMASSCFRRLVGPIYPDGISSKRMAVSGNPLPSPRRISLNIHSAYNRPDDNLDHLFMVWGQFFDHDISLTPQSRGSNSELLNCCPVLGTPPVNCDPILVERDDSFYRAFNITCLNNVRSARCSTCSLGAREQINQLSAYIDASQVYGSNLNLSRGLRSNDGTGTLRSVVVSEGGELPPGSFRPDEDECSDQDPNLDCFEIGDSRANQHPALTSLHILFLREHNRIARDLRNINPKWSEETLFQEARRIVGAEMQMITYNEYLPLVIGKKAMKQFALFIRDGEEYTSYRKTMDASLVNEFSTAAFRFGHSTINSFFPDMRGSNGGSYLRDTFNYPFGLYKGQLEGIVGGLLESPSQNCDRYIVQDVTNHLYKLRGNNSGLDLASLNINRGRDHGIPGYTTLVEYCGGPRIRRWYDLDRIMGCRNRALLNKVYEDVRDIDLFTGGLLEKSEGAAVGPTFACIIGKQFYRLKYGDRFYFEHGGQVGSFTPDQLREIKKVSLGKIICDNSRLEKIQKKVLLEKGPNNPVEYCKRKPGMNLKVWRAE